MRQRPSQESLDKLASAIREVMDSGWDSRFDVLWDAREKIKELERLSNDDASYHRFLFDQNREFKSLITYLLIAMNDIHEQVSNELGSKTSLEEK